MKDSSAGSLVLRAYSLKLEAFLALSWGLQLKTRSFLSPVLGLTA
ncbi:hypothetical protein SVI_3598 [Shewanella violacea DSS12]|uniref:Uncharacterized protein n=1 Tax=Shewanella violacea (strain JCM 10179 / CIP 106290 / LMG 19151 / DSS12) TaxID=637905 RepID=D4ZC24_SHEVD|nr:hypothetical protein SVI_3598 [Shewanella violacea DSS12]